MSFDFFVTVLAFLFSVFVVSAILGVLFSKRFREEIVRIFRFGRPIVFEKSPYNPILLPGKHAWTAESVMNPAALLLDGRTHIIYRAIGSDGVSRLGYASSSDGIVFDQQHPYPAFVARDPNSVSPYLRIYSPVMYPSGGSWGGLEDPRMVSIEGRIYVTFTMFQNWALYIGCISISEEDFLAKRFYAWDGPFVLSHSGRDKNWVLFPEKIHGKFAVLHSVTGETDDRVRIEYTDDLKTLSKRRFASVDPQQSKDRLIAWHSHVRGAGPPPVKTDRGWLLFYHAHAPDEPHRYKLGAMLLDLEDPTRILYRASIPVISPDEVYENDGKPGVVFACGAVVRDGLLYIYYGGADKVTCVATTPLDMFVDALVHDGHPSITS